MVCLEPRIAAVKGMGNSKGLEVSEGMTERGGIERTVLSERAAYEHYADRNTSRETCWRSQLLYCVFSCHFVPSNAHEQLGILSVDLVQIHSESKHT